LIQATRSRNEKARRCRAFFSEIYSSNAPENHIVAKANQSRAVSFKPMTATRMLADTV